MFSLRIRFTGWIMRRDLKRSPIPFVTFIAGLTGCALAFLFKYWTSAVDWPINVGGKPFNSWPAFVPIMFELTVLFAGLCTVGAMFAFNGLPNVRRKIFDPALTRDRYAIVIEAPVPSGVDPEGEARASSVPVGTKLLRIRRPRSFSSNWALAKSAVSTRKGGSDHVSQLSSPLSPCFWLSVSSGCLHEAPNTIYMPDMVYQPSIKAQSAEGDRLPVEGNGFARLRVLSL